jgi:hypothetical protein
MPGVSGSVDTAWVSSLPEGKFWGRTQMDPVQSMESLNVPDRKLCLNEQTLRLKNGNVCSLIPGWSRPYTYFQNIYVLCDC